MKKKGAVLAEIQHLQDQIVDRFCSVKRRVHAKTDWYPDATNFPEVESEVLRQILFYEVRGYYLFQEPVLEHQPMKHRYRVLLTFRPTESNS